MNPFKEMGVSVEHVKLLNDAVDRSRVEAL